ncbi:MAG: glycosyltransferase, partial [Pseudomonadota bacterium]
MHRPLEEIQTAPQGPQSQAVEPRAAPLTRRSVPYQMDQKFSIVHVVRQYAPSVGGLENAVRGLARVQRDAGHRVKIITLNRLFTAPETTLPDHDVIDGIEVVRIPFFGSSRYPIAASIKRWLDDQDIIHVHGVDFFFDYLAMSKPKSAIAQIASTHGGFFHTS